MDALERLRSKISSACRQTLLENGQQIRNAASIDYEDLDFDIKIGEVINPKEVVIEATIDGGLPQDLGVCRSKTEIMDALLAASMGKQSGVDFVLYADEEPCRPICFSLERYGLVIAEGSLGSQLFLDVCLSYRRFDPLTELYIY